RCRSRPTGIANHARGCASHATAGATGKAIRQIARGAAPAAGEPRQRAMLASFRLASDREGAPISYAVFCLKKKTLHAPPPPPLLRRAPSPTRPVSPEAARLPVPPPPAGCPCRRDPSPAARPAPLTGGRPAAPPGGPATPCDPPPPPPAARPLPRRARRGRSA